MSQYVRKVERRSDRRFERGKKGRIEMRENGTPQAGGQE